jgi:hypothetical protein
MNPPQVTNWKMNLELMKSGLWKITFFLSSQAPNGLFA